MTVYSCDTCDTPFPGGAKGSTFIVEPDGKTHHMCSQACLRAFVNRMPSRDLTIKRGNLYATIMMIGILVAFGIAAFLR